MVIENLALRQQLATLAGRREHVGAGSGTGEAAPILGGIPLWA
jgi:hypothetical protein